MDEVRRLLGIAQLITLVGPGGVGKTRVALELARRVEVDYDAVAVADLVELSDADSIEHWLVSTVGVVDHSGRPAIEVLIEYLSSKQVLLVVDNCEHLWEAIGDVVTVLLKQVPELSVVVTSRRPLEIDGEHVFRVPPLTIPPSGADRKQAAQSDAVALLVERSAAGGRLIADGDDWDAVVELVRWSGGLPLVLELIAARLAGGLSPATIMQRLDGGQLLKAHGRRLLPHHRTLQKVLDWSYGLCAENEQRLWARLSVFCGGFDLAMAEEVCGDPDGAIATPAIVDLLTALVRQSIVIADPDGRFRQLPPTREYGLRQLHSLGEEQMTRERHCALIRRIATDAAQRRCSPAELSTLRQIHQELPNIRAALTYCTTPQRAELGLRIATDITQLGFSFFAAFLDEFCTWLETFLKLTRPAPASNRVAALAMLSLMRLWRGDQSQASAHRRDCLDQVHRLSAEDADLPIVTFLNGMHMFLAHRDPSCLVPLTDARDAFSDQNARADLFKAQIWLAIAAGFLAPEDTAEQAAAKSLTYAKAYGGSWSVSWALWAQGRAARDPQTATLLLQQALRMMIDMGDQHWGANMCVEAIAWEWAAQGHALAATHLLGATTEVQQTTGVVISGPGPFQRERGNAISRMRATLGDAAYTAAFQFGNELSTEDVYALALSDITTNQKATSQISSLPLDTLTTRQQQIAQLITQGLSNKEIANRLHISQRTAENHLAQIFARLKINNRAQLAAWVTEKTITD